MLKEDTTAMRCKQHQQMVTRRWCRYSSTREWMSMVKEDAMAMRCNCAWLPLWLQPLCIFSLTQLWLGDWYLCLALASSVPIASRAAGKVFNHGRVGSARRGVRLLRGLCHPYGCCTC